MLAVLDVPAQECTHGVPQLTCSQTLLHTLVGLAVWHVWHVWHVSLWLSPVCVSLISKPAGCALSRECLCVFWQTTFTSTYPFIIPAVPVVLSVPSLLFPTLLFFPSLCLSLYTHSLLSPPFLLLSISLIHRSLFSIFSLSFFLSLYLLAFSSTFPRSTKDQHTQQHHPNSCTPLLG